MIDLKIQKWLLIAHLYPLVPTVADALNSMQDKTVLDIEMLSRRRSFNLIPVESSRGSWFLISADKSHEPSNEPQKPFKRQSTRPPHAGRDDFLRRTDPPLRRSQGHSRRWVDVTLS